MKLEANPDDLVTLVTKSTEFEAHAIVAVLEDAGIEAVAFGAMRAVLPLSEKLTPVPVQVRVRDLDRARDVLRQNQEDSVDLDWEDVDVGERADDLPLTNRQRGMPLIPRLGFLAACMMLLLILLVMITRGLRIW